MVVLDWTLTEAVLALGLTPAGVPAPGWYDRYVVAPALPDGVIDVGLLFAPNFELIQALRPDLILVTPPLKAAAGGLLARIAPVEAFSISVPGPHVYRDAVHGTQRLAAFLNRPAEFDTLRRKTERDLQRARTGLAGYDGRPFFIVNIVDDRHVTLYGKSSLYGAALDRLGLNNAWPHKPAGGFATLPLTALAEVPDARLVAVRTPVGGTVVQRMIESPFWQALPFVRAGRVAILDCVMSTGGLPSLSRFASLFTAALSKRQASG